MSKDLGGVVFNDYSDEVLDAMQDAVLRALTRIGMQAEGYAKDLAPVDTGLLKNSITYAVSGEAPAITSYEADNPKSGRKNRGTYTGKAPEDPKGASVYIGTNVEYAVYQECGTGSNTEGGRPTNWIYQDDDGNTHMTGGNTAKPFLKPAVADHAQTYRNIIEDELKNG